MQYDASTQSYQYVSDQGARNIQLTPNLKLAANEPGSKPFANVSQRVDINVESGQNLVGELRVSNREQFTDFTEQQQSNGNPRDFNISFDGAGNYSIDDTSGNNLASGAITDGKISFNGMDITLAEDASPSASDTIQISNGEPIGRNPITLVSDLAAALEGKGTNGQWEDEASWALDDLNKAMDNVVGTQADIGARMNVMESARTQLRDADVVNQTARAELADVDYNEAVTELVKNETLYQASQQVFSRINQLSLFDYVQ